MLNAIRVIGFSKFETVVLNSDSSEKESSLLHCIVHLLRVTRVLDADMILIMLFDQHSTVEQREPHLLFDMTSGYKVLS